jgi:hypothetical protein
MKLIRERITKKARKEYYCMACMLIREVVGIPNVLEMPLERSEIESLIQAGLNHFQIKVGEPVLRKTFVDNGKIKSFTAIPEVHAICIKYNLYPQP